MTYECHITIAVKDAPQAVKLLERFPWEPVTMKLGDSAHFYFLGRDENIITLFGRMTIAAKTLRNAKIGVLREKIELIVYDTKTGVGL